MENAQYLAAIEAIIMVASEPVALETLAQTIALSEHEVSIMIAHIQQDYRGYKAGRERGFELQELGGGWRIYSNSKYADIVSKFIVEGQSAKLTTAALETLAVIAYRGPVSRGKISAIRGVSSDSVIRTLITRGIIAQSGNDPDSGAILYVTTSYFLEKIGLKSLSDIPDLAPYIPNNDLIDEIEQELP